LLPVHDAPCRYWIQRTLLLNALALDRSQHQVGRGFVLAT
jgi:hypothetical protein